MTDIKKLRELAEMRSRDGYVNMVAECEAIIELIDRLERAEAQLAGANEVAEFYGNKNNWNRDANGWRHDMIEQDLDDETLTDFEGRFSGKRARQYLQKWGGK